MQVVIFCQSIISDWNHGNAHFLRGISTELLSRGHSVRIYEPEDSWSLSNLLQDHGPRVIEDFLAAFPALRPIRYRLDELDLEHALDSADLVLVHEWNDPELIRALGEHRARSGGYSLLFHDTHHRIVTQPQEMARFDLRNYDGVLAFGSVIAELYRSRGLAARAWTWHEAADTRVFSALSEQPKEGDLVWIGNWGDDERAQELQEFLFEPVSALGLKTRIHGVRYPRSALEMLESFGIEYSGWLANYRVPHAFAGHLFTVHVPRRPYVEALPGIPTIRVFEALACGIPLISAPWEDSENLFEPGRDFLVARSRKEMTRIMKEIVNEPELAADLARRGRQTVLERHTCAHRVNELLVILAELNPRAMREDTPCAAV